MWACSRGASVSVPPPCRWPGGRWPWSWCPRRYYCSINKDMKRRMRHENYTLLGIRSIVMFCYLFFRKFRLQIRLHIGYSVNPTVVWTCQKCFTKHHDWAYNPECIGLGLIITLCQWTRTSWWWCCCWRQIRRRALRPWFWSRWCWRRCNCWWSTPRQSRPPSRRGWWSCARNSSRSRSCPWSRRRTSSPTFLSGQS